MNSGVEGSVDRCGAGPPPSTLDAEGNPAPAAAPPEDKNASSTKTGRDGALRAPAHRTKTSCPDPEGTPAPKWGTASSACGYATPVGSKENWGLLRKASWARTHLCARWTRRRPFDSLRSLPVKRVRLRVVVSHSFAKSTRMNGARCICGSDSEFLEGVTRRRNSAARVKVRRMTAKVGLGTRGKNCCALFPEAMVHYFQR